MALAKSVNKLLLAASASKGRLKIVVTWYFMFAFGQICLQFSIRIALGGLLFKSDSIKRLGSKLRLLFESPPRPLLKLSLRPLDRYGTHQETISRRPEQMYTPSDTGLEWLGEGPLFKSVSNRRRGSKLRVLFKPFPGPLLKIDLGPLFRYGTHQTINWRSEQVYLPSDPKLEWPGKGPLFEFDLKKCQGQNVGTICVTPWVII